MDAPGDEDEIDDEVPPTDAIDPAPPPAPDDDTEALKLRRRTAALTAERIE